MNRIMNRRLLHLPAVLALGLVVQPLAPTAQAQPMIPARIDARMLRQPRCRPRRSPSSMPGTFGSPTRRAAWRCVSAHPKAKSPSRASHRMARCWLSAPITTAMRTSTSCRSGWLAHAGHPSRGAGPDAGLVSRRQDHPLRDLDDQPEEPVQPALPRAGPRGAAGEAADALRRIRAISPDGKTLPTCHQRRFPHLEALPRRHEPGHLAV